MAPKMTVRIENLVMKNVSKYKVSINLTKIIILYVFKPFLIENDYKIQQSRKHKT